jgi:hypothetical protein
MKEDITTKQITLSTSDKQNQGKLFVLDPVLMSHASCTDNHSWTADNSCSIFLFRLQSEWKADWLHSQYSSEYGRAWGFLTCRKWIFWRSCSETGANVIVRACVRRIVTPEIFYAPASLAFTLPTRASRSIQHPQSMRGGEGVKGFHQTFQHRESRVASAPSTRRYGRHTYTQPDIKELLYVDET